MKVIFIILLISLQLTLSIFSQNTWTNNEYNLLNEQGISPDSNFHYTIKPFSPKDFKNFKKVQKHNFNSNILNKLFNDNLFLRKTKNYKLALNPILHSEFFSKNKDFYRDSRIGVSIYSDYKNKIFFATDFFYANRSSNYYMSYIVPHYGKALGDYSNSFISFTGELSYHPNKNIYFQVGKGKHFFGNGYRSLFLSDNSNSYPYIKTTIDIWKIKYVWMAAKLKDFEIIDSYQNQSLILFNKAAFIHYFSLNLTKRININFFETIITNPYDHNGNVTGYDAGYYNPVIFFRPVEFYSGTSDNSMLGLAANIRLFKNLHLYSQFILDDLIVSRINDGTGYWGNKFGIQAGLKIYNLANINGLFFRGEINIVRPYTYSHGVSENGVSNLNYGHYYQNLSHPSGANFAEAISEINYNKRRYMISAKIILEKKGTDIDSISYGGDSYKSYTLRPGNENITFLQGELTNYIFTDFNISYLINPNYKLKFKIGSSYRKITSNSGGSKSFVVYFGLSTNLFNENDDFF